MHRTIHIEYIVLCLYDIIYNIVRFHFKTTDFAITDDLDYAIVFGITSTIIRVRCIQIAMLVTEYLNKIEQLN